MQIDIVYIIIFTLGLVIGGVSSYFIARRSIKNSWLKTLITIKDPEMWNLGHFFVVDEEEKKKSTNKYTKPKS